MEDPVSKLSKLFGQSDEIEFGYLQTKKSASEDKDPQMLYNPDFTWFVGHLPLPMPTRLQVRSIFDRLEAAPKFANSLLQSYDDEHPPHPKSVLQFTKNYLGRDKILQAKCLKYGTKVQFRVDTFGIGNDGYHVCRLVIVGVLDVPKMMPAGLGLVDEAKVAKWKFKNNFLEPNFKDETRQIARFFIVNNQIQLPKPKDNEEEVPLPYKKEVKKKIFSNKHEVIVDIPLNNNSSIKKRLILCNEHDNDTLNAVITKDNIKEVILNDRKCERTRSQSPQLSILTKCICKSRKFSECELTEDLTSSRRRNSISSLPILTKLYDEYVEDDINKRKLKKNVFGVKNDEVGITPKAKRKPRKRTQKTIVPPESPWSYEYPLKKRAKFVQNKDFVFKEPDTEKSAKERYNFACTQFVGIMGNYHAIQFESETLELLKFQKLTEKITEKFLTFQPSIYRKTEEEIHLMEELNHKLNNIVERFRLNGNNLWMTERERDFLNSFIRPPGGHR